MDSRLRHALREGHADHDIAKLARARDRVGPIDWKCKHVSRTVIPAVLAVQRSDLVLRYELDREVTVCDGGGAECGADQLLEVGRDVCQV